MTSAGIDCGVCTSPIVSAASVRTDDSLSVRATARFTLHLVHGLQNLFGQVRTFAFVSDLVEITDLFEDHPVEQALGLVFGGDVLDVDANSDYGAAFGRFKEDFGSAVNRRSTVIVLGDGRGNGNDPNLEAFAEITRRARETIWLTPASAAAAPIWACWTRCWTPAWTLRPPPTWPNIRDRRSGRPHPVGPGPAGR